MTEINVVEVEEIAVGMSRAHQLLGFGEESDWLVDPACPVPRCDIRKPGSSRPLWVWLVEDLRAFVQSRRVLPGQTNPQAL